jgi:hypothetical protein
MDMDTLISDHLPSRQPCTFLVENLHAAKNMRRLFFAAYSGPFPGFFPLNRPPLKTTTSTRNRADTTISSMDRRFGIVIALQ